MSNIGGKISFFGLGFVIAMMVGECVNRMRPPPPPIPAATAAEAALVCQPFDGLQHFRIEVLDLGPARPDGPPLQRYRVTALCKSSHAVAGVIALEVAQ